MPAKKSLSYSLLSFQLLCMALLAKAGPLIAGGLLGYGLELPGLILGLWSIAVMKIGNFNITPDARAGSRFVAEGPYRAVRHPMYLATLMVFGAIAFHECSLYKLALWILLLAVLLVKIHYEENQLVDHFSEYSQYRQRTKRMIPCIF